MTNFPILTLLVLLPAIGSLVVALISNRQSDVVKLVALLTSVATGGMALWTLFAFEKSDAGFQFVSEHSWIKAWGISWHLGVDGISIFLVVLTVTVVHRLATWVFIRLGRSSLPDEPPRTVVKPPIEGA